MQIGIIEAGEVIPVLRRVHGSYGGMLKELISKIYTTASFEEVKLYRGQFPKNELDADFWVISGSRHGVYDTLSWISPLKKFILRCVKKKVPIFGICFGHQILAEALGGKVRKFDKGWGLGVHKYDIKEKLRWDTPRDRSFCGFAIHQDQILVPPPDSIHVATSEFCKYALLAYGNNSKPYAVSIQSHPELTQHYVSSLIRYRLENGDFPKNIARSALRTLSRTVDNQLITSSILNALVG